VKQQRTFDLIQLDAKSSNFHLIIQSAEELEVAVRPMTDQIATY